MATKKDLILKWNLDDILPLKKFDSLYKEIEEDIQKIGSFLPKLKPNMSEADFRELICFEEDLIEKMMRLYDRAHLMETVDEKSATAKLLKERSKDLYLRMSDERRKIDHWIIGKESMGLVKLDDRNAKRLFKSIPDLEYILTYEREAAKFILSEPEERIITEKDSNGINVLIDFRELLETELVFSFKPYKNKPARIIKNRAELASLTHNKKPEVRRAAYNAILSKFKDNLDKFFIIYQSVVKNWTGDAKRRGYSSPIAMRNFMNHVPDKSIEVLLDVCAKNKDIFQRFFKWKAKQMGVEKLSRFDIYAPLQRSDKRISFREAIRTVLDTFEKFSPGFAERAKKIIDERHLDSHPSPAKRSGAFCATIGPKITPYILLNYTGRVRDVATLAHELGHGIHSLFSNHLPISSQHATLPLAETASTLGELILFEQLLSEEKNPKVRQTMLAEKMADCYATIIRQNYFVNFEIKAHEAIQKGITAEGLSDLWLKTLEDQFGNSVAIDPIFRYEWAYIPHIVHTPFYCYAYSFGELLSFSLFRKYKELGPKFVPQIERLLSHGGSKSPADALKEIGIDITSSDFWQESFNLIKEWQLELEKNN